MKAQLRSIKYLARFPFHNHMQFLKCYSIVFLILFSIGHTWLAVRLIKQDGQNNKPPNLTPNKASKITKHIDNIHTDAKITEKTLNLPNLHDQYAISMMTCGRPAALNLSLHYLHEASSLFASATNQIIPVYVSLDCPSEESELSMNIIKTWNSTRFCIFAKWFEQAHYPKNPDFSDERVNRHWLSRLKHLFQDKGYAFVTHLEDDHVVSPTFFHDLISITTWDKGLTTSCFNLGCHRDCWGAASANPSDVTWMEAGNMGVTYSKNFWNTLVPLSPHFCSMRGIWDINIHILQSQNKLPIPCATFALTRATHMMNVGSARRGIVPLQSLKVEPALHPSWRNLQHTSTLVDKGIASYQLESSEYDPPLPSSVQQECMDLLNL